MGRRRGVAVPADLTTDYHHSFVIISLPQTIISSLTIITNTENWIKEDKLVKMHCYWVRIVNAHYASSAHQT